MGVQGQFLKKRKLCLQNLTKEWKQPPVVIVQQAKFCNIFILCLQIRIMRQSDQGVQLVNFPSQILFNDIGYKAALLKKTSQWHLSIYMDVASYCYYENGCTMNARSLEVMSATFLLVCFICQKESTCEIRKNTYFYFVLEIINF